MWLLLLFCIPVLLVWQGFCLSLLWGWFVVPKFSSLPVFSAWEMAGVVIVLGFFARSKPSEEEIVEVVKRVIFRFLSAGLSLLVGWVIRGLM